MKVNYTGTKLLPVVRDYGCRDRMPHDLKPHYEDNRVKIEICHRCSKKLRFKKGYSGRIDNRAYLEAHARNFCQPGGRTRRLYHKIHNPDQMILIV